MTNQQILEKAIQKAIDGRWKGKYCINTVLWINSEVGAFYRDQTLNNLLTDDSYMLIIFNHDFAKALWGNDEYEGCATHCVGCECDDDYNESLGPAWQYHLQQMVIAEDPIKYIGEHLDG